MREKDYSLIKIELADPTPLGLLGLAMVTLVASTQKLGLTEGVAFILPWAIFLGAIAQIIASLLDFKHNNLFGSIAFSGYGLFWLGVSMSWMVKAGLFGAELATSVDSHQLGYAFLGYFIFSIFVTIAAFRLNTLLSILMILIDLLLLGLACDTLGLGSVWHSIAAYSEILVSALSFYGSGAALVNKSYGRIILPTGKPWTK